MSGSTTLSLRNREKFVHEGHMYTLDRLNEHLRTKSWRCDKRYTYKCRARLHTWADTGKVIRLVNEHNHESDPAYVAAITVRNAALQRAETTMDTPAVIINEVANGIPVSVKEQMPSNCALRQAIRRRRKAVEAAPPMPVGVASVVIPKDYQTYGDQERFLLFDSGLGDEQRILVFGRQSAGQWSSQMKHIVADGTFRIAPPEFAQVYVIMAERGGFVLPVLYALLPNKHELTYRRMFESIKAAWPQFDPETITLDFEQAAMNAATATFPSVQVYGCFFHFARRLKRQLSEQGLLSAYNSDANLAIGARMIASLAFMPTEHLEEGITELSRVLQSELLPVLAWFENAYVGRAKESGGRDTPPFPPNVWSIYESMLTGRDRMNNFVEATHRRMRRIFGCNSPTIWRFIEGIRKIQTGGDVEYERYVAGVQPPRQRAQYDRDRVRLYGLVETYRSRTIVEHLRAVAHNFLMH
ncbi:MULE and FLYWCH domain containing protein [Trichuris trichiura]|uniref:MULE and FLYWCH domain containing protein n=1 Tax=Trichuris trichiura TaxID=36087 RepID=A0A077Z4A1_TRITR|nr:MULE and FLYWCH domain containing protein [Trichuris trichiura]